MPLPADSGVLAAEPAVRPTIARYGAVNLILPWNKTVTRDFSSTSNIFDQINDAGIPVPDAAPTLALIAGTATFTNTYIITFYDSNTGVEGNPSATSASISPVGQAVRVTNAATNNAANSRVTHWRIYRTVTGATTVFFRIAEVLIATTTFDDDAADSAIQANDTVNTDLDAPPNNHGIAFTHRAYTFLMGARTRFGGTDFDSNVVFSMAGSVDNFASYDDVDLEPGIGGIIRGAAEIAERFVIAKDSALFVWEWDNNPSKIFGDGHIEMVPARRGSINERTIKYIDGSIYSMDVNGIYKWNGDAAFMDMSLVLRTYWDRLNWTVRHVFFVTFDREKIWFFVALDDDNECHHALVYDLQADRAGMGGRWWVERYDHGFVDGGVLPLNADAEAKAVGLAGQELPYVQSASGHMYLLGRGTRDGIGLQVGVETIAGELHRTPLCTVASGSSNQIICDISTHTFEADSVSAAETYFAAGIYIRFVDVPDLPDAYQVVGVSGVSSERLNFSGGPFSAHVFDGTEKFYIAPIPFIEWRSGVLDFGDANAIKMLRRISIEYRPLTLPSTLNIAGYKDRLGRDTVGVTLTETGYALTAGKETLGLPLGGAYKGAGGRGHHAMAYGGRPFHYFQLSIGDLQAIADAPYVIDEIDYVLGGMRDGRAG